MDILIMDKYLIPCLIIIVYYLQSIKCYEELIKKFNENIINMLSKNNIEDKSLDHVIFYKMVAIAVFIY